MSPELTGTISIFSDDVIADHEQHTAYQAGQFVVSIKSLKALCSR
jgi:hypothetical protein